MNKKQNLAIASTTMLAAGMAQGAITWSGPINYEIGSSGSFPLSIDNPIQVAGDTGVPTEYNVRFDGNNKPFVDARSGQAGVNVTNSWTLSLSGTNSGNAGAPLVTFGKLFDTGFASTNPPAHTAYLYNNYGGYTVGAWPLNVNTEGYVGVELNSGNGLTNYGWIHIIFQDQNSSAQQILLVDTAYETTTNQGIIAGVTNEPGAPTIYYSSPSTTNGGGSTVSFNCTVVASPQASYQWQSGLNGVYTNIPTTSHFLGTTTTNFTINSCILADGIDYIMVASNSLGMATSAPAILTVVQTVLGGPNPSQAELFAGENAYFGITVLSGTPTGYDWQFNGTNLANSSKYSGATSTSIIISNVTLSSIGNYDDVVKTSLGNSTSSVAPLNVLLTNGLIYENYVLANQPFSYYRLNEIGDPSTNGLIAFDDVSEFNGVYGADVQNGNPNYGQQGPQPSSGFVGFTSTNAAILVNYGDTNSVITLPPWNLNTNTVTFTAWINPNTTPSSGMGIVFTRGLSNMVCGMRFDTPLGSSAPASLGYDWNDAIGAWNWGSGLQVPVNQWSFVALVVTPTNVTAYVINTSGVGSAVNNQANPVQSFNTLEYIGTDPQGGVGGDNFSGSISQVAVFAHSLTANQILALYGAGAYGSPFVPPTITVEPSPQTIYAGSTAHLVVVATGSSPLTYQWQSGTGVSYTNVTIGGNVYVSPSGELEIQNFSAANVGNYQVVVSNGGGSVTSSVASTAICAVPTDAVGATELSVAGLGALGAYYRLDETNDPSIGGTVAYDYAGGFNGVYGTAILNGFDGVLGPQPTNGFLGFSLTNYAAQFNGASSLPGILAPPMYLNTNEFTVTAWINPAAAQNQYTGIAFWRGGQTVAGLDMPTTNINGACLGYQWNATGYAWNSGIVPPNNQWSFVAAVIDAANTNATVYMFNTNGFVSASQQNTSVLANQLFDTSLNIGNDPNAVSGTQVFNGVIDEVGVYTTALSSNQLLSIYNAASGVVTLNIVPIGGGQLQIQWSAGTLLQSTNILGPFTPVLGATAPTYNVTPTGAQVFYKAMAN